MKWQVADLSNFEGRMTSSRGCIVVHSPEDEEQVLPVADLAVILIGSHVQLSGAVLHRLNDADVSVLFCDWRGVPEGGVYSWSNHGRVGARHRAQAHLSEPRRKNAWARIVRAKIRGQAAVLDTCGYGGGAELNALAAAVRSGDPSNIEAQAARKYWSVIFEGDGHRLPGSGEHAGINACLDYGYTILRGHCLRATLSAGLCASLGIFHRGRSNMFALTDDLIEVFRPAIDDAVLHLGQNSDPSDKAVKAQLVQAASRPFSADGRGIPAVAQSFAQQFGRYVEGDIARLDPPVWHGPVEG